jgi:hypothetical protein
MTTSSLLKSNRQGLSIADRDTLTILDVSHSQHKIRLAGIEAPEKSQLLVTVLVGAVEKPFFQTVEACKAVPRLVNCADEIKSGLKM